MPRGLSKCAAITEDRKGCPSCLCSACVSPLPFVADKVYRWQGRSGETYPDRKKGGAFGIWESPIEKPDYLVPQEYGCHMDTHCRLSCMDRRAQPQRCG
ncbi:MAG: hypothetical protein ACLR0U_08685 [Enterocloster clostridioformis]